VQLHTNSHYIDQQNCEQKNLPISSYVFTICTGLFIS